MTYAYAWFGVLAALLSSPLFAAPAGSLTVNYGTSSIVFAVDDSSSVWYADPPPQEQFGVQSRYALTTFEDLYHIDREELTGQGWTYAAAMPWTGTFDASSWLFIADPGSGHTSSFQVPEPAAAAAGLILLAVCLFRRRSVWSEL